MVQLSISKLQSAPFSISRLAFIDSELTVKFLSSRLETVVSLQSWVPAPPVNIVEFALPAPTMLTAVPLRFNQTAPPPK